MDIQNKKISEGEFSQLRQEVLTQWPTGKDVNLEEAFAYHKALPEHKIFGKKLSEAKKQGITLIQPRAGVALIKEHVELLQFLQDQGGADLLPTTTASFLGEKVSPAGPPIKRSSSHN